MIKAVLDTNQFISSLLSRKGVQAKLIEAWREEYFELAISPPIINEIEKVLNYPKIKEKYELSQDRITALIALITSHATIVPGKIAVNVIADDPADNQILACAFEAGAHFIVTGDVHLLKLEEFEGIPIITGRAFLNYLESKLAIDFEDQ